MPGDDGDVNGLVNLRHALRKKVDGDLVEDIVVSLDDVVGMLRWLATQPDAAAKALRAADTLSLERLVL